MVDRRRFIRHLGVIGVAGLAGCSGGGDSDPASDGGGGGGGGGGNGGTQTPTPTATATPTATEDPGTPTPSPTATPVPPLGDATTWPMYGFDTMNSNATPAAGPTGDLSVRWSNSVTDGWATGPAIINDSVYVGTNSGVVYALNPLTGWARWKTSLGTPIRSDPAVDRERLYIAAREKLVALDAATGAVQWELKGSFGESSPTIRDDLLYIGGTDGLVRAIDTAGGEVLWTHDDESTIVSTPAVAHGFVIIGAEDGIITGLEADTGNVQWSQWSNGAVFGSPTVAGSMVFMGNDEGTLFARNAISGSGGWTSKQFTQIKAGPATDGTNVYTTDRNGALAAIEIESGEEEWRVNLGQAPSDPIVTANGVYVAAGSLYSFDRETGDQKWSHGVDGATFQSPPVVADGNLVTTDTEGTVYFFEPA